MMSTYQLFNGDCLDFMRTLDAGSVDAVITDPPYGIEGNYKSYDDTAENLKALVPEFIREARRVSKRCVVVFTGVKNMELYNGCDWRLAWVCPQGSGISPWGFTCWTPISVYGKDPYSGRGSYPDTLVDYKAKREGWDHPYEKPLSVMRWIVERCSFKQWTIFDPFMGSGTTGVACMQLGRNFIGCEIDAGYFSIAEKRISEAAAQPALFHLDAPKVEARQEAMQL